MVKPFSLFILFASAVLFISYSANPPQGVSGAPGESTCNTPLCHTGNTPLIQGDIAVQGLPGAIQPSTTYNLNVILRQTAGPLNRAGFQMTIIDAGQASAGVLFNPGPNSTVSSLNNRDYFEHQPAKTFNGIDSLSYSVEWTSPENAGTNDIVLYIAANFTNGSGNQSGDKIVTFVDTLSKGNPAIQLEAAAVIVENGCYSGENTDITFEITGGCPPYTTQWAGIGMADTLYSVGSGTFSAVISDCTGDTIESVVIVSDDRLPLLQIPDTMLINPGNSTIELASFLNLSCGDIFEVVVDPSSLDCMDFPGLDVSISLTDSAGLSTQKNLYFQVEDTIAPSLTCFGQPFRISTCAPFSYARPQALDNCGESISLLIEGIGVNESFPEGTTYDIYEATDLAGNTALCTVTVINELAIDLDIQVTDISCFGLLDGRAEVDATGPNPPYQFGLGEDFLPPENLGPGAYELVVEDRTGCRFKRIFVVEEPDSLVIEDIEVSHPNTVNSGDGMITPAITGGSPPFEYQWYTEDELFSTDPELTLLFPGKYLLEISDSRSCMAASDTIFLEAVTAVYDQAISGILDIRPNPVKTSLHLGPDFPLEDIEYAFLVDGLGSVQTPVAIKDGRIALDKFSDGVYYLVVVSKKGKPFIEKVIKLGAD